MEIELLLAKRSIFYSNEFRQKVDLTKYIEESIFNFDYAFD